MGLIKKLIGGFFSFLGGIFSVFNIFKKSEYYLEYDESKSAPQVAAQPAAAALQPAAVAQSAASATVKKPSRKAAKAQAENNNNGSTNGKVANFEATVAAAEPVTVNSAAGTAKPSAPAVFAPTYLGSGSSNSRRRPGPSLNRYMDMAKQVTPQK